MKTPHKFAGLTMLIGPNSGQISNQEVIIEDYWENVYGKPWGISDGNPAAILFAVRSAQCGFTPDNEVLYGKIGGLGYLVHVSELCLIKEDNNA